MTPLDGATRFRLEEALQLLPDFEALEELRSQLLRASRPEHLHAPDATFGKRRLLAVDLEQLLPDALSRKTQQVSRLYSVAITALGALQLGDHASTVAALIQAGELEEQLGQYAHALAWYQSALNAARPLRNRRPEIETLCHLGGLEQRREHLDSSARYYQRSLALADAESLRANVALACCGLGDVSIAQTHWQGAAAWYTRGLQHAGSDDHIAALLTLGLAQSARQRGEHDGALHDVKRARELVESSGNRSLLPSVLNEHARLERARGHLLEALALHQQALSCLLEASGQVRQEIAIRLELSRLYLDWGRLPDAEDESRRAESLAVSAHLWRELAQTYLVLGQIRGREANESGFIFYENAIALCRGREPLPRSEAQAYLEYGTFRFGLGDHAEACANLLRANEILEALGDDPLLPLVRTKLAQIQRV